VVNQ
jgi:hypothetical protein